MSINKIILIGRLTKAPEQATTQTGKAVSKFTLAVDRYGKDADFLNIVCFDKTAELVSKYVGKGSKIAVVGSIQTRNYEAQDGTKRYVTEIVANEVEFLDSKKEEQEAPKTQKQTSTDEFDGDLPF